MRSSAALLSLFLLLCPGLFGQERTASSVEAILQRLDKLEQQNRELAAEVQSLRQQLAGKSEHLDVQENRVEELAQTKVEASQRSPISVTGMALFNVSSNGRYNGVNLNPTVASLDPAPRTVGATFRQSVIGLQFRSPHAFLGAQVNGSLYLDFFANSTTTTAAENRVSGVNLNHLARLRVATVEIQWDTRSLTVGQDKPIISVREPNSLSQVGVSPLTNAGNPWLWQPQVRFEQRFALSDRSNLRAQFGIFQTAEQAARLPDVYAPTLESSRPGWEGRLAFSRSFPSGGHLDFAPGFHLSTTHVAATSVPSRIYSFDWSIAPIEKLDFSGYFFTGQNTASLGTLRQGFTILGTRDVIPVHSVGGWAQLSYVATPRLTFNIFGGQQDERDRDLLLGDTAKNAAYAGNAMYRIAPNVIISLEAMQFRTRYVNLGRRLSNRYDLALAYLF